MNILVLSSGNSARSILLECVLRSVGGGSIHAFSAGSQPADKIHPQTLRLLAAEGQDISQLRPKSLDNYTDSGAPEMDAVITVCKSVQADASSVCNSVSVCGHWGVADLAEATAETAPADFRQAYEVLCRRAEAFAAGLEVEMDQKALQKHITNCGMLA